MNASRDGNSVPTLLGVSNVDGSTPVKIYADPVTHRLLVSGSSLGTVTSVSVVSANGFAGTVADATTTPAITLSTTVTGILKGNGTAISAASAGTDYVAPGAVTTSGLTMATARILGRSTASSGAIEEISIGSGLSLAAGVLSATGSGITVGTTTITSGTNTRILYDNSGVVGEYVISGTGDVAMTNSPIFVDDITIGVASSATGQVKLVGTTSGTVTLSVADAAGTWTMKLPTTDGDSGQFLQTDGSGNTTWATPSGSGTIGGTIASNQVAYGSGADTIQGSANLTYDGSLLTAAVNSAATDPILALTQASTGDAALRFALATTQSYAIGIDNSASDAFVISGAASGSAVLGTGNLLSISTAGILTTYGNVVPSTNDGGTLGGPTTAYSDLFLASGGVIDWANNNYLITHSSGLLTFSGGITATAGTVTLGTIAGAIDAGGATSFEIPNSAAPTVNADGEIAVDTSVTDFSHGIMKYYGGEELGVVAMPIAQFTTPTNGYVVKYNSTNDEFELGAVTASAGGSNTQMQYNSSGSLAGARIVYSESGNNSTLAHTGSGTWTLSPANNGVIAFVATAGSDYAYWSLSGTDITYHTPSGIYPYGNGADVGVNGNLDFSDIASSSKTFVFPNTAGNVVIDGATQTLTNKRVTPRVGTTTSSATPTINTDNVDYYSLTAQTVDITSFTTNLSGTPTDAQKLWISITGTAARAITWGSSFEASTVALPTTTVSTNRLDVGFIWNAATSKWRCVATA